MKRTLKVFINYFAIGLLIIQTGCKKDDEGTTDSPFTDSRDGKVYEVVQIGNQIWMAENLDYQMTGSSCYQDSSTNCTQYGKLYSWNAAKSACPSGWHLPGDKEWKYLEMNLGMSLEEADAVDQRGTDEGTQLKAGGNSGFNVLFGGIRDESGVYTKIGTGGAFWTSTEYNTTLSWYRGFSDAESRIHRYYFDKDMGFSVRCVKSLTPSLLTKPPITIATKAAVLSASLIYDGGSEISERGFCWSTDRSPTIINDYITDTTSMNELNDFSSLVEDLQKNTTYYIRAYAKNEFGIGYGNEISFKTKTSSVPIIKTTAVTNIGITTAQAGGEIVDNGEREIISKGVCWSTLPSPTIQDDHTQNGTGTESFIAEITGLNPNTIYHIRAYAVNDLGISYGESITCTTIPLNPVDSITDTRDGTVYKTINIGEQWWLAENLNFEITSSWCYENSDANCSEYGRLYTFSAANSVCPSGWHLPSDSEWKDLEMSLGMSLEEADAIEQRGTDEGTQLKDKGSSGFDVLFGGFRNADSTYTFLGTGGAFWTSSSYNLYLAWYRGFQNAESRIHRYFYDRNMGFSVRCIKNK